jgi:predicted small secreted protein
MLATLSTKSQSIGSLTHAYSPFIRRISMKLFSMMLALVLTIVISGCNTIEGMGKDVEAAGDAIEKSASENKNY